MFFLIHIANYLCIYTCIYNYLYIYKHLLQGLFEMFIGCDYHTQSAVLSFEKIFLLEMVKNICEVFLNLNFYKQINTKH